MGRSTLVRRFVDGIVAGPDREFELEREMQVWGKLDRTY
jgi:hypothetical protein